jgi:hypothetical protein
VLMFTTAAAVPASAKHMIRAKSSFFISPPWDVFDYCLDERESRSFTGAIPANQRVSNRL